MSRRRRTHPERNAGRTVAPASGPQVTRPDDRAAAEPQDLHRRAVELREYRMGRGRMPADLAAAPAVRSVESPDGTITTTVPVLGMTCRSCEVRINRHVGRLPGVERVNASAVRGHVQIASSERISHSALAAAIAKAGYAIGRTPWLERDPMVWATAGVGVLLVAALAVIAQVTGLGGLASGAGDLAQGGLVVALLLGLAAGVSTCMALVGGLVLGLAAAFQAGNPNARAIVQIRPALVFVGGRIGGYVVLGAGLGAVGASVTMPPQVTAFLMIAVAVVMTLLGTRLTGVSPRLAGWSPTLPMGLGEKLGLGGGSVNAYSDGRAATLGALSFFLPCGFTQAIQIYALSTGSPLFGAALLGTFAIGTAPGLLGLAGLPIVVPSRAKPTLLRLVGVVVLGFAFVNGAAGLRLSGLTLPTFVGAANAAPLPGTLGPDGVQSITTYQDADGYRPSNVVIYAGYPTRWTIQSSTTATCAASLWAPDVDLRLRLRKGPNLVELPALRPGTLNYTCAMGMYGGRITVVAGPATAPSAPLPSAAAQASTATPTDSPPPAASAAPPSGAPNSGAPASDATASASAAPAQSSLPAIQELRTYQDWDGYGPSDATIRAGVPTRWTIESRSSASCATFLVVPSLDLQRYLVTGDENVIDLPALQAGTLEYTCSMGMYWGSIRIVDGASS
jgi:sulfite exporter TauE/SafE/plastocyanin domain-containing protein/copper chaperone CopZ